MLFSYYLTIYPTVYLDLPLKNEVKMKYILVALTILSLGCFTFFRPEISLYQISSSSDFNESERYFILYFDPEIEPIVMVEDGVYRVNGNEKMLEVPEDRAHEIGSYIKVKTYSLSLHPTVAKALNNSKPNYIHNTFIEEAVLYGTRCQIP